VFDVAGVVIEVPRETRYPEIASREDVEMSWEDWEGGVRELNRRFTGLQAWGSGRL